MADTVLALDFGTSGLRCLVTDARGRVLGAAEAPLRYHHPRGAPAMAIKTPHTNC